MSLSRRSFVATAASLTAVAASRGIEPALASVSSTPADPRVTSEDDPLGVRDDFPVVRERTYLNSAYITPVPRQVVAAGRAFVESKSLVPIMLSDMLRKTDEVRGQFARLVNASSDEIGFLFATSEGENVVANALDLGRGDNVVIDELHYETEFVLYRHLESTSGVELRIAKHRDGAVEVRDFEPLVDRRTKLVSVAWVSHQNGFRHDMRPIADLAPREGSAVLRRRDSGGGYLSDRRRLGGSRCAVRRFVQMAARRLRGSSPLRPAGDRRSSSARPVR